VAFFDRSTGALLEKITWLQGRRVFVDAANGDDDTGDGSSASPFQTLVRGAQEIRSGFGDVLIALPGSYRADEVVFSEVTDFALIGSGASIGGAPFSSSVDVLDVVPSAISGNAAKLTYTVPSGSEPAPRQGVILYDAVENGASRINGAVVALSSSDGQFDATAIGLGEPGDYPPTQFPQMVRAGITLDRCKRVVVAGWGVGVVDLTAAFTGVHVHGCADVMLTQLQFSRGYLGVTSVKKVFQGGEPDVAIIVGSSDFANTNVVIEGSTIGPQAWILDGPFSFGRQLNMPAVSLVNGVGASFVKNLFTAGIIDNDTDIRPYEDTGAEGLIHVASNPGLGHLFSGNQFLDRFGDSPATYDTLFHFDAVEGAEEVFEKSLTTTLVEPAVDPLTKTFARGNFFDGATSGSPVTLDDTEGFQDLEPNSVPNQSFLNTWGELVWRRRPTDAIELDLSMGRLVAQQSFRGAVWVDTIAGQAGTDLPAGTPNNPVNNLADALVIASANQISELRIRGTITLDQPAPGFNFQGNPFGTLDLGGQDVNFASMQQLQVTGAGTGEVFVENCIFVGVSGIHGRFNQVGFQGTFAPSAGVLLVNDSGKSDPNIDPVFDLSSGVSGAIREWSGGIQVENVAQPGQVVSLDISAGRVGLGATNTDGTITVRGVVDLDDQSAGSQVVRGDNLEEARAASAAVDARLPVDPADESLQQAAHAQTQADVAALNDLSPADAADAVWDEALSGHQVAGSAGQALESNRDHVQGRKQIDTSNSDQWQEVVFDRDTGAEIQRYDLRDQNGAAVSDANNPLVDPTGVFIAERIPV